MSFRLQITGINSKSSQSNPGIDIEEPNPIRELIASHADLSASHYDLSANHSGLKSTVTDLSASHYDLSRNNSALKSTVSDLSASHYDLSANHSALKSTVSDLSASHYDLSRNNIALKSTVSDLSASHYDLSRNHSALKTLVTDLSGSHYDLSANHSALKSTVSDLNANNNIRFNNIDISLSQVYTKTQSDSIFVSKSNIDLSNLSTNIIPSTDNTYKIGDISKNWRNAYIKDISSTNIDIANNLNVFGPTQLTNTLNVAGNVTLNGSTLYAPPAFTIDPYGHDNNTGTVFINGNLIVQGLTTTINSTTIDISDKKILLASNAKNSIEATGAGFEISGANVNFIYDYPSSAFRSSIGLSISGNVVPANSTIVNLGQSDKRWNIAYIDELNVNSFTNSINGANITSETITSTQIMNNTIVDGDISNNAAIAFSKINATNAIVDGDISDNANILGSKLAINSITSDKINQSNNWTFSQLTSNTAYIRDISASNISISGNIIPLDNSSSDLGSLTKRFNKIFTNDLSVNTINGQAYNATTAIDLTSVSGNIIPSSDNTFRLGDTSRNWSNAYITDISASNISISGNILPLDNSSSDLGSLTKRWRNIFVNDLSVSTINGQAYSAGGGGTAIDLTSVTTNIIPSSDNTFRLGDTSRNWSNAYIRDISASNISISGNIIFNISGGSIRIAADASTNSITTTHRIYQNIRGGINDPSWAAVNGYYALAKDAYPGLNPLSSGDLAVKTLTTRNIGTNGTASWNAICWSPELGIFVVGSLTGIGIMISSNGVNWTPINVENGNSRSSIVWSRELRIFVAVFWNGYASTSTNGINWIQRDQFSNASWYSVCWAPEIGRFVAVGLTGTNNRVMTSVNGINWTRGTNIPQSDWYSVVWSPELRIFVAMSAGGINYAMTSRDGINWAMQTNALFDYQWRSICWSPQLGIFVAIGQNRSLISNNGINWNIYNSSVAIGDFSISWSPELKLFFSTSNGGTIATSNDGINWTTRVSTGDGYRCSCWSPELGIFVSPSTRGYVLTSSLKGRPPTSYNVFDSSFNSIDQSGNWTFQNITTNSRIYQNISGGINDLSWSSVNGYYALAKDAYPALNPLSSGDLAVKTWIGRVSANETNSWRSICWSPQLRIFVAVAGTGTNRVMTSPDGITWTGRLSSNESHYWSSVCWSPELRLFVAVSFGGWADQAMTSSNGITWTTRVTPPGGWWSVCWSPERGIFVAVARTNTKVMTSSDGITWTARTSANETNVWYSVCWSPQLGIFVAVAQYGSSSTETDRIMTSPDGISWSKSTSTIGGDSVCWSEELGLFVSVRDINVLTSPNGITWTTRAYNAVGSLVSVCWSKQLRLFVAVVYYGSSNNNKVITSPNGTTWTGRLSADIDGTTGWSSICWSPELGIFAAVAETGINRVMTSSLQGRPPTSYNVFDSSFNSIDQSGNWTFQNIDVSSNLNPSIPLTGSVGTTAKPWGNAVIRDLSVSTINGQAYSAGGTAINLTSVSGNIIPSLNNNFRLGDTSRNWSNAYIRDISASNIDISGNIIFSISGGYMRIAADASTSSITTSHRIYQNISGGINDPSWSAVNGYYALAKDSYPGLNPYSSGAKAIKTWTARASVNGNSNRWTSICWSPELRIFVAVAESFASNNRVMTSPDGITWTGRLSSNDSNAWQSVCWSPELRIFVAVASGGDNKVMTSSDGITWTGQTSSNETNGWWGVCWSPQLSLFVAVSRSGSNRVMTSPNGTTWTGRTSSNETNSWRDVCWSGELGLFVAVGYNGSNRVMTSSNGITWTGRLSANEANEWWGVCWSPELRLFVAVANIGTNRVMISNNGTTWTEQLVPITGNWRNVCWSPELGLFAATANFGGNFRVMTSSLQGRPPTSYNVFDSTFNSIDQSGNWTFQNIDISTNLNPSSSLTGNLGTASKIWGNAVIRDLSIGSIDVGINVYPSLPNSGSLGLSNKRWANAFVNDLSVSTINGQAYSAGTAIDLTSVSGNIIPSLNNTFRLGDISRNWSNAYIHDISATNISVSGNIIPLDTSSSDLGSLTKRWRNIYVNDLSVITINGQAYSKLAELTTNLIIHNADTSTARLYYKIKLINAGTITAYTNFPIGGVGSGMTHSVRVCIPNIATIIGVEIDPQDINILSSVVSAGAIPYGEFVDETLSFTFDPAGYDNIEIGFEVVAKTGWYGNIFLELLSLRPNGAVTTYNYTIYKGSTDQTPVLVSNQTLSNNLYNTVIGSVAHVLTSADRLENDSSSFFVTINSFSGGSLTLVSIQNGTLLYNPYQVQPSVIGTDVRIRFAMEPD